MLECRSVTKKFGDFKALDNVSIEAGKGRVFGLLGPNGAGKTTLIRIINRITIPTEGEVFYNGKLMNDEIVREIGYLPEERGLYKKMKVGEQAIYLARLKGLSIAEARKELKEWFVKFGIRSWWDKKVEELSKGMAQKVQFITTVLHKPSLLILDEPFAGFDPVNVQLIRDEIIRMKDEGATIILSTHNMESVEELCDDIALINRAKLVVSGPTGQIREKYGSNQVEVLYRSSQPLATWSNYFTISKDEEYKHLRRAILDVSEGAGSQQILPELLGVVDIVSYKELVPRMKDIFIKLVSEK
ncbi:MAG TPA: ATP-binding cassette domain-containing protein [Bacteroidales bacterium]|jgi:ABC-2 type transport system ATP-binding protein|nr:ATP-binding cassette domain-containing protein [Bacteroidales bacterium]HPB89218.1 ATP-binding cassette domain-containing protein [Bacteroidales bacterium]HQA93547.1 ATP-binding cassette domain-containing protein [Bacteroidales bacterium]HQN23961.1 ATP-binding cassette domain-containing protein [Bacteroidales bacterium]HQP79027.1 ATP-binding cassette domain-containing protein [Bacteroidales bacterium]